MTENNHEHDISKRDTLKVLGVGALGLIAADKLPNLESESSKAPFEAYISSKKDRVNLLCIKDKTSGKVYVSMGTVSSGETPDGLPATIFTQTAALESPTSTSRMGDAVDIIDTKTDPRGLNKNVSSKLQNIGTMWADMSTNADPSSPDFLTQVFKKQEELKRLYDKLGINTSVDASGLIAFPVKIDIIEVRDLVSDKPDHLILSMHAPDSNNTFVKGWKLTALNPIEDSKIGYGKGVADSTIIDRPVDVIFSAPTPELKAIENETPKTIETDLKPVYTETARGEFLGVPIVTNLITDESLDPIIHKVERDDSYKNFDAAMSEFMAYTIYKAALKTGGKDGTGIVNADGSEPTLEEYMTMVKEARAGTRSYEDIQIVIKANDMTTEGYDAVKTTCWPFYDEGSSESVPTGVRAISNFSIVLFKFGSTKISNHHPEVKSLGTNILNSTLYIYRGTDTSSPNAKTDMVLVQNFSAIPYFIANDVSPKNYDITTINILSNDGKSQNIFRSIFKIN